MVEINNLGIILIVIVVAISAILFFLFFIEKRINKKIKNVGHLKNKLYIEKLSKLNPNNADQTLKKINKIAKIFFKEAFKTKNLTEYGELKDFFIKKNNKKASEFCDIMNKTLYSQKIINKKLNSKLVNLLAEIIESNPILSKQEKKDLDKKSQKKGLKESIPFLRKIKITRITKKKANNKQNNSKD